MKEENSNEKPVLTLQDIRMFSSKACFVELNDESVKDSVNIQSRRSYLFKRIDAAIKQKKEEWQRDFSHYEGNRFMKMPPIPVIFLVCIPDGDIPSKSEKFLYDIPSDLLSDVDIYLSSKQDIYNNKIIVNFQKAIVTLHINQWFFELSSEAKSDPSIQIWSAAIRKNRGSKFFNEITHYSNTSNESANGKSLNDKSSSYSSNKSLLFNNHSIDTTPNINKQKHGGLIKTVVKPVFKLFTK